MALTNAQKQSRWRDKRSRYVEELETFQQWDIYFASLAGWMLHPGYQREDTTVPTIQQIADMCDAMMEERNARLGSSCRRSG